MQTMLCTLCASIWWSSSWSWHFLQVYICPQHGASTWHLHAQAPVKSGNRHLPRASEPCFIPLRPYVINVAHDGWGCMDLAHSSKTPMFCHHPAQPRHFCEL